jgi:cation:H+ antiporter
MLDFQGFPLWLNLVVFIGAAVVVWRAGTSLSAAADEFAEYTGIGRAFIGALLLGGVTSLPEATTTITAAAIQSPDLAINNIVGGVAIQVVVLAIADGALRREPLSLHVEDASVLLNATFLIMVLTLTTAGLVFGDHLFLGFGLWNFAVFACSIVSFWVLHRSQERQAWRPIGKIKPSSERGKQEAPGRWRWGWALAGGSAAILVAGYVITRAADALAIQTGLHAGFVGAVTLALATSLPEISTTIGAVRIRQFSMAYANIFGANILDLALLFFADLVYTSRAILSEAGGFAAGVGLLCILLTSTVLVGLLERRRIQVLRLGVESWLIVVLYLIGLALIYQYA